MGLEERYWTKVDRTDVDGCWPWTAHRTFDGYGVFWRDGRDWIASRVGWELAFGPIPDGMLVLHSCDNRACQQPAHWFLGTNADNMADKMRKGRWGGKCVLTHEAVREIRQRRTTGESCAAIGRAFGVHRSTVSGIIRGERWRNVA